MPMPKAQVLQATSSLARTNDWEFLQTLAPSAGPGAISDVLRARINPGQLPKSEPSPISATIGGYTVTHNGRHKTNGTITFTVFEDVSGEASIYFEALRALNNPRNAAGQITGVGLAEADKEGEYIIRIKGSDGKIVKSYVLKQAVVNDIDPTELAPGEEAEFVSFTVTIAYKDYVIKGPNGQVLA